LGKRWGSLGSLSPPLVDVVTRQVGRKKERPVLIFALVEQDPEVIVDSYRPDTFRAPQQLEVETRVPWITEEIHQRSPRRLARSLVDSAKVFEETG
jgi:hypothetical protein